MRKEGIRGEITCILCSKYCILYLRALGSGNVHPLLGGLQRVLANVRIFLEIFMEKRKKNGASLPERRISTGYS